MEQLTPALGPRTLSASPPVGATRSGLEADWLPPDKYELRRVIGTGGMGTVLLARDRNTVRAPMSALDHE